MKTSILIISFLCVFITTHAQQKAITEKGDEVFLYEDGTWKYADDSIQLAHEIPVNPKKFIKNPSASFLLKSSKINTGFWIDAKKWTFKKAVNNDDAEYELQHKTEDLYGMIITEKLEIPLETLREAALDNAQNAGPDVKITHEEYRTVNDLRVLQLEMKGTISGIKVTYFGYYFSSPKGTVQFLTYSSQELMSTREKMCEELLNGLVLIEP